MIDSYCLLKCGKCGHEDDFFEFTKTPVFGELPRGSHQCPSCKKAWKMEKVGEARTFQSGGEFLHIPADRKIVPIPSFL